MTIFIEKNCSRMHKFLNFFCLITNHSLALHIFTIMSGNFINLIVALVNQDTHHILGSYLIYPLFSIF